jgi:hypothetical protein
MVWIRALILFTLFSGVRAQANCNTLDGDTTGVHYQILQLRNGPCTIELAPEAQKHPKRNFRWDSEGRFGVFVDLFSGANSVSTMEKAYYIVPAESHRLELFGQPASSSTLKVSQSGLIFEVDKSNQHLDLPAECEGTVRTLTTSNSGGVDLNHCQGHIVIDVGSKLGGAPEENKGTQATLRDSIGHTCQVPKTALFNYSKYNEFVLKFHSKMDWIRFLKNQPSCHVLAGSLETDSAKLEAPKAKPALQGAGSL